MVIDPTITFGAIMNAAVLLIGFVVAFTRISGRIDLLSQRVGAVEEALKSQRDASERLVAIETRQAIDGKMILALQADIRDLRHGRGFVQPRANDGIDGEYP